MADLLRLPQGYKKDTKTAYKVEGKATVSRWTKLENQPGMSELCQRGNSLNVRCRKEAILIGHRDIQI